ncbi:MAG: response regulator [Chloroflexi bacterium]|nr:MAG: response regulator [Chloroflexota bacterium]
MAGELICILEQDPLTLQLIAEELEEAGFATLRLSEAAGSLVVIKENRPDLLVLDTSLETQEIGWTLLESVRSDRDLSAMPVIVCASDPSLIQTRSPLLRRPPETSVFLKPFNPEALLKMIRATLHPGQ